MAKRPNPPPSSRPANTPTSPPPPSLHETCPTPYPIPECAGGWGTHPHIKPSSPLIGRSDPIDVVKALTQDRWDVLEEVANYMLKMVDTTPLIALAKWYEANPDEEDLPSESLLVEALAQLLALAASQHLPLAKMFRAQYGTIQASYLQVAEPGTGVGVPDPDRTER